MPGNAVITRKGIPDSRERVEAYLDAIVGDDAASERWAAVSASTRPRTTSGAPTSCSRRSPERTPRRT